MSLDVLFFVVFRLAFRSWRTFPKQHRRRKNTPETIMVSGVIFLSQRLTGFAQTVAYFCYSTVFGMA